MEPTNQELRQPKLTWRDVKAFIDALPDEELESEVIWWGDERGGKVKKLYRLDEDYVRTDEGYEPASCFTAEEMEESDYSVELGKGQPIVGVD